MTKQNYLVVYDYGQGGVWAIIRADSPSEINAKYPELTIYESKPDFLDEKTYGLIASKMTVDIDDPPSGWLRELVNNRK